VATPLFTPQIKDTILDGKALALKTRPAIQLSKRMRNVVVNPIQPKQHSITSLAERARVPRP
jgi:hypothetical protein